MAERSNAQRAADARHNQKRRGVAITLRLNDDQAEWLELNRLPGESRAAALRRMAGLCDTITT